MQRLAASLLFAFAALPALAAAPTAVEAEYRVTSAGVGIGRVRETFERKGDAYAIQSTVRSEGPLKLFMDDTLVTSSEGRVVSGALQPHTFEQKRLGNGAKDIRASFDWKAGVMHSRYRGEASDHRLPEGTQDRLSIFYQFMHLAAPRDTLQVHATNGRKVELYTYRKVEDVRLQTPAGEFDTVHYERVTEEAGKPKAHIWLARDRFHLPVRIVFDDPRGLRVDQTLTSLKTH